MLTKLSKKYCIFLALCASIFALLLYQKLHRNTPPALTLDALNTYTLLPCALKECAPDPVSLQTFVSQIQHQTAPEVSCVTLSRAPSSLKLRRAARHIQAVRNIAPKEILGDRVILYSRGYAFRLQKPFFNTVPRVGGGVVAAYTHIRDNIIHLPCITFDKYDGHAHFSFGQDLDIACLNTVYDALLAINPDIQITLMADCLGGLAALRFIARYPEKTVNIDTIILESPLVSAHDFFEQTPKSIQTRLSNTWLYKKTGITIPTCVLRWMLHTALCWWFSSYDPARNTLDTDAVKNKRIFIGHLQHDFVISNSGIADLVAQLRAHNSVTFVTLLPEHFDGAVPAHCQLALSGYYQGEVEKFLSPP
jgi:hypothetical protein